MANLNYQIGLDEVDDDYKVFVDKFKPKKTTDDCYTPPIVFDSILRWVVSEYGIDPDKIIRPFYPGGDYIREDYPEGWTVVDNPPFSILSEIVNRYMSAGVPFFLFAPHLTLFSVSSGRKDICRIITNSSITYENGAQVNTAFLTNLDKEFCIRTCPELSRMIKEADDKNRADNRKEMPRYEYPDTVITPALLGRIAKYIEFKLRPDECTFIRSLDSQKSYGKALFGGGLSYQHQSRRRTCRRRTCRRRTCRRRTCRSHRLGAVRGRENGNKGS